MDDPTSKKPRLSGPAIATAEESVQVELDALTLGASSILILGDGDMSFANALATHCRRQGLECHIVATELGDPGDLADRYFDKDPVQLASRMTDLERLGVSVVLGVDSTAIESLDRQRRWREGMWRDESVWSCGASPFGLVIWNFPHTTKYGQMAKLLERTFEQLRMCAENGKLSSDCIVQMRLRHLNKGAKARHAYGHEQAAQASGFELLSVLPGDIGHLEELGYRHCQTSRNATAIGFVDTVKVWSWRKLPIEPNQDTQVVAPAEMEVMELERPQWYVDISDIDFKSCWDKGTLSELSWKALRSYCWDAKRADGRSLPTQGSMKDLIKRVRKHLDQTHSSNPNDKIQ